MGGEERRQRLLHGSVVHFWSEEMVNGIEFSGNKAFSWRMLESRV